MNEKPLTPRIKQYLSKVLPKGGRRVLANAEHHDSPTHYTFFGEHLPELAREHDVANFAVELPAYMNIFLWAYRDGNLPVPKESALDYLHAIYEGATQPEFRGNPLNSARPLAVATDYDLRAINYDARVTFRDLTKEWSDTMHDLKAIFREHPRLREALREDSRAMERVVPLLLRRNKNLRRGFELGKATREEIAADLHAPFTLLEAERLQVKFPQYRRWVENAEAVVEAGRRMGIDNDAMSAAMLVHQSAPGNTLCTGGAAHMLGIPHADFATEGTFSQHLENYVPVVTRSMIVDEGEFKNSVLPDYSPGGYIYHAMKMMGSPSYLPDMVIADRDKVICDDQLPGLHIPGSHVSKLAARKRAYERDRTEYTVDTSVWPAGKTRDAEHVGMMQAKLDSPEMQDKFGVLRER